MICNVSRLCDVEALFADAFDFVLELDSKGGDVGTLALCAEGVGFAAHFLQNESEVLALGAAFLEGVQEKLVVTAEARDFFVDVEFVGHDAGFLQQADVVDFAILQEHVDAFLELVFPDFDALRVKNFNLVENGVQVIHAAFEIASEIGTFLGSHFVHLVKCLVEFGGEVLFKRFGVCVGIGELQNFGEGQNMFQLDIACNVVLQLHGVRDFDKLFDGGVVVGNGNVSARACAKRYAKDDRTADQLVFNLVLETIFEVGQVLGQLARDIQKAVVHAADFNHATCALVHGLALPKPRHR